MGKLDKIYESLGIDKLDEEKQTEIKQYLDETIELKAKEVAESKVEEEKEKLVEKYEEKFEEYKNDITTKFSDFVDDIMEKELQIPEKIKEYARIGEKYQPVMEQLITMMGIDQGKVDEQARNLLKESREEIVKLKDKVNELTNENMEVKADAKEMASNIYLRKKCDGLTEAKRERIMKLLEDVTDKDEIDRKFKIITEDYSGLNEKTLYCKECDKEVEVNEDDDDATCPDCGGSLMSEKRGKSDDELDEDTKPVNEDKGDIRSHWLNMIRENRF